MRKNCRKSTWQKVNTSLQHSWLKAASCLLATLLAGCAADKAGPVPRQVITSREHSLRGVEAMQRGEWQRAEGLFCQAIEACPTDERTRSRYAETLLRRGDIPAAISHMEQAVKLSGGDPNLQVRLGEMHLQAGDLEPAGSMADQALQRNRQLAAAWALQGDVFQRRNMLDEALASYHRAICYQPHFPRVQFETAKIYHLTDRPYRALTTLESLADQFPPGMEPQQVMFLHGLTLKRLQRYEEAVESLAASAARSAPSHEILFHLGESQMLAGKRANAILSITAALDANPYHQPSRQLLTHLQSRQEQLTAALRQPLEPVEPR